MKNFKKPLSIAAGMFTVLGLGLALRTNNAIRRSERNFPPLGKFCSIQGSPIHYYTEGKGPVVVLLHGEKGDIYDFYLSPLWNKLKENYQVVAFDRPGNGYSKRTNWKDYGFRSQGEIIHQALEKLKINNALLLGYGESSGIVLSMLIEHEDAYKGAIILEDKVPDTQELIDKMLALPIFGNLLLWTLYPLAAQRKAGISAKQNSSPNEYLDKVRTLDTHPAKLLTYAENKKFMQSEELEKLTSFHTTIKKPVTLMHSKDSSGENGKLFSSLNLGKIIADLKIIPIPGSENLMAIADSEILINEIDRINK